MRPMIGVIGWRRLPVKCPQAHRERMAEHGLHANAAGNWVYFTVGVEGALFGAGDLHAAMGDGEIVVCGQRRLRGAL